MCLSPSSSIAFAAEATNELIREREKLVYAFGLEASYEEPPPDVIETVPLFAKEPD